MATLDADAMRRAARRIRSGSRSHTAAYASMSTAARTGSMSSRPTVCSASQRRSASSSCTITAPSAARHQASVPGRSARWKSASSAVSVRRGSSTTMDRSGSRAIAFNVVRACGKLCDCHGFLPTKTATSACSMSPRTKPPRILPLTQNSPVFSCASAFERYRLPRTARVADA